MNNKTLNRILLCIIGILVLIIFTASVTKLVTDANKDKTKNPEPTPQEITSLNKYSDEKLAAYTGIGRIRIVTKADNDSSNGTPIVLSPWFTYAEGNIELYEELSKKRILISGIISNYFSQKTKNELLSTSEDKIKADLLTEINSQLVLGKITKIYFTDYIFLE